MTVVLDTHALLLSPSGTVDEVWHVALLLPRVYTALWHALLVGRGQPPEVIDHAPIFADAGAREDRIGVTKALCTGRIRRRRTGGGGPRVLVAVLVAGALAVQQ